MTLGFTLYKGVHLNVETEKVHMTGFDFPWGFGAYAPRFCCGPLDLSV